MTCVLVRHRATIRKEAGRKAKSPDQRLRLKRYDVAPRAVAIGTARSRTFSDAEGRELVERAGDSETRLRGEGIIVYLDAN